MTLTAPVRPAPIEPTTPIRPSEAIRLGCLIAPVPLTGAWGSGPEACVNRALVLGYSGEAADEFGSQYLEVDRVLAGLVPPCGWKCLDSWYYGGSKRREPSWVLIHLNDARDHRWSRERIADWLESCGL